MYGKSVPVKDVDQVAKWDRRLLDLASLVASWSRDPSTKCGAVITDGKRIVSTGFNGFPQGMPDDDALYANREEKYSRVIHAEMNALLFAREDVHGYTCYTTLMPCDRCFVHLAQAGITRYVYPSASQDALERWQSAFWKVKRYAAEMGLELVEVS